MAQSRIYKLVFADVYPLLLKKLERKEKTKEDLDQIIMWLTGYDEDGLKKAIDDRVTYPEFFEQAPKLNENRHLIKGSICGVKVQEIEDDLVREARYLDKLIDELYKGKAMDKVLRSPNK